MDEQTHVGNSESRISEFRKLGILGTDNCRPMKTLADAVVAQSLDAAATLFIDLLTLVCSCSLLQSDAKLEKCKCMTQCRDNFGHTVK